MLRIVTSFLFLKLFPIDFHVRNLISNLFALNVHNTANANSFIQSLNCSSLFFSPFCTRVRSAKTSESNFVDWIDLFRKNPFNLCCRLHWVNKPGMFDQIFTMSVYRLPVSSSPSQHNNVHTLAITVHTILYAHVCVCVYKKIFVIS